MSNLPLKTIQVYCVLSVLVLLTLPSCFSPTNLKVFLEDEKVREIIEGDRVGLIDHTGDNLRRGNSRITGLNPGKYYRVETLDENGEPLPLKGFVFYSM